MRVPLALFGHSENVLSKHGPSAVGSAIQVIGLYSSPSFVQRVTEDMKRFLVKFLSLSNISHFTLRDRIAQLPHEDPKVRRQFCIELLTLEDLIKAESAWGR
jgi:hypothetical protein